MSWIAPLARPSPVAYLSLMFVSPAERGSGVGTRAFVFLKDGQSLEEAAISADQAYNPVERAQGHRRVFARQP